LRVVMVAWGGIEPPTQGFSIPIFFFSSKPLCSHYSIKSTT